MSLKLYMDQHVHSAVSAGVRQRGIDVLTAFEDQRSGAADEDLLERATTLQRVLFSQDVDFIEITNSWLESGRHFSGVIFAHQQKATVGQLIGDLELVCRTLTEDEIQQQFIRLPL